MKQKYLVTAIIASFASMNVAAQMQGTPVYPATNPPQNQTATTYGTNPYGNPATGPQGSNPAAKTQSQSQVVDVNGSLQMIGPSTTTTTTTTPTVNRPQRVVNPNVRPLPPGAAISRPPAAQGYNPQMQAPPGQPVQIQPPTLPNTVAPNTSVLQPNQTQPTTTNTLAPSPTLPPPSPPKAPGTNAS